MKKKVKILEMKNPVFYPRGCTKILNHDKGTQESFLSSSWQGIDEQARVAE